MIKILVILMLIDTFIGWAKSFKNKNFKSYKARLGVIGKLSELLVIYAIYLLDTQLTAFIDVPLLDGSILYFIVVEFTSIIENYILINNNLPPSISSLLVKIREKIQK